MLLLVLEICHYSGSFPYTYDAEKKQFVFSRLGFIIFLNACFFSTFSLGDVYSTYIKSGGIDFISLLTLQTIITNMVVNTIKVLIVWNLKAKLAYYNKVLQLYLEEGSDSSISSYVFIYYIVLLVSTMSDYLYFLFVADRRVFLFKATNMPNRLLIWSLSFQFVAVSIFLRRQFEVLNVQLKELLQGKFGFYLILLLKLSCAIIQDWDISLKSIKSKLFYAIGIFLDELKI